MVGITAGRSAVALAAAWVVLIPALQAGAQDASDPERTWQLENVSGSTAWLRDVLITHSGTLLAAGDSGTVLRSADRGASWLPVSAPAVEGADLSALWVDSDAVVWLVGSKGLLLRSDDDGQSWARVIMPTSQDLLDIHGAWDVVVTVGRGGAALRSMDAGETWEVLETPTDLALNGVCVTDDGSVHVAAGTDTTAGGVGTGLVLSSKDEGGSWTPHESPVPMHDAYCASDEWIAIVGRDGTIMVSSTAGDWWEATPIDAAGGALLDAVDGDLEDELLAAGGRGTILRSGDGGMSWSAESTGVETVLSALRRDGDGGWWAVGAAGVILQRSSSGSWTSITAGIRSNLLDAWVTPGGTSVAVGWEGTMLRRAGDAEAWEPVPSGTEHTLMAVTGRDDRELYAVGQPAVVLRSTDGGISWTEVYSDDQRALTAVWADAQAVVATGDDGSVLRSTDGTRWTVVSTGTSLGLTSIRELSSGQLLVAAGGSLTSTRGEPTLLRSTDRGTSWSSVAGAPGQGLLDADGTGGDSLIAGGLNLLAVTGADGSWTTLDLESVTRGFRGGLEVNRVLARGDDRYALVNSRQIIRSADAGQTWTILRPTSPSLLMDLTFTPSGGLLTVGQNGTIFRWE